MPQQAWTRKQERQYEHIKRQSLERGYDTDRAEEIAARTRNEPRKGTRAGAAVRLPKTYRRRGVADSDRVKISAQEDARELSSTKTHVVRGSEGDRK